jgi:hypothetical protein
MTVRRGEMEDRFLDVLRSLQPRNDYFPLFREIVLDCWKPECDEVRKTTAGMERRVSDLKQKLARVEDRFISDEIDQRSYRELRDRLRYDLALAELDRNDANVEEMDVERVLAFAQYVIENGAALWTNASPEGRRAIQSALFPNGLVWDGEGFGTVTTCLALNHLPGFARPDVGSQTLGNTSALVLAISRS